MPKSIVLDKDKYYSTIDLAKNMFYEELHSLESSFYLVNLKSLTFNYQDGLTYLTLDYGNRFISYNNCIIKKKISWKNIGYTLLQGEIKWTHSY